ncbi:MAG: hypothetical protein KF841_04315 [Phycisphaerae bacterium]|nr:hypothetical protein [Phycisphaerae bacterium]
MSDFEISRPTGKCCVTQAAFVEEQEFFTVVVETESGLERRDYSLDAWTGPPDGALCYYKTRMPKRDQPKRLLVDDSALVSFFKALADASHPTKQRFRFVLALILLRKRLLKYERTIRENDTEIWEMRLVREKTSHRVHNPVLREDEIAAVSAELGSILHGFAVEAIESESTAPVDDSPSNEATDRLSCDQEMEPSPEGTLI